MGTAKKNGSALHLLGLCPTAACTASSTTSLPWWTWRRRRPRAVFIHAFLDGRDTPPSSALEYIDRLEKHLASTGVGRIATVSGRYYAMDRDKRWERVQKAYEAVALGGGIRKSSAVEAVRSSYENKHTDEFVLPTVIVDQRTNAPLAAMQDGTLHLLQFPVGPRTGDHKDADGPAFDGFRRSRFPKLASFVCLTTYDETFGLSVAYPPARLTHILGEVVSGTEQGSSASPRPRSMPMSRSFFNGGEEQPFPLEDRVLIPSPRDVAPTTQAGDERPGGDRGIGQAHPVEGLPLYPRELCIPTWSAIPASWRPPCGPSRRSMNVSAGSCRRRRRLAWSS